MTMPSLRALASRLLLTTVLSAQKASDPLPRRGWFGVALAPLGEGAAGAAVTGVAPGSPAAVDGMKAGDVIRAVDGAAVRTPADVVTAIARHAPGSTAIVDVIRAGEELRRPVVLRAFPMETLPGVSFEYGSVTVGDGTRLRTIVSVPDRVQQTVPAVMLLGGRRLRKHRHPDGTGRWTSRAHSDHRGAGLPPPRFALASLAEALLAVSLVEAVEGRQ
jgi:membrane-associated protease RseP (regulator of RpoE activity)